MPDLYTPASVSTGTDGNADFLLRLDSQQRYDRVFNDFNAPIDYKIPQLSQKYGYNGLDISQILNPQVNNDALKGGMTSDDPAVRDAAWNRYDKNFVNDPVNRGVGRTLSVKAEPWQEKYKNDTFGFLPSLSQQENEDYYYRNQYENKGDFAQIAANVGKFAGRTILGAALKLGEGLGYIGAMAVGGIQNVGDLLTQKDNHSFMTTVADNALSRYLEGAEETLKNSSTFSVYKPNDWDRKGFFEKMSYGNLWSDEMADGAAFLLSAAVPGSIIGKVGSGVSILAKSINPVTRALRAGQTMLGLETLGDVGSVVYNTVSESAFEAAGVYKQTKQQMQEDREAGTNTLTDEEIDKRAGEKAAYTFKANMGILSASSLFENKFIFKPLAKKLAGISNKFVHDGIADLGKNVGMKAGGEAYVKEAAKNVAKKFMGYLSKGDFNKFARIPFYGGRATTAVVMEGYWEENAQLAAERVASNSKYYDDDGNEIIAEDNFFGQLIKQTKDSSWFGRGDTEAATSIGLGAVIGVVGGSVMAKAFGGGKFWKGERQGKIDEMVGQVSKYNKARQNFLSVNDIYKRDENKEIVYEDNKPVVDEEKVAAKIAALTEYGYRQMKAEDIKDDIFREKLQKDLFAEYMVASIRAGLDERLVNNLQQLPSKTKEEIEALGFDPVNIKTDIQTLVNNAKTITEEYKNIYGNSSRIQKSTDPKKPMTFDEYDAKEDLRKFHAFLATTRSISSKDAINAYNAQILDKENKNRDVVGKGKPYDVSVKQYNDLQAEETALLQAQKEFNSFDYKLVDDVVKERLKTIKAEKEEVKAVIDEMPEAKELREEDGMLVNRAFLNFDKERMGFTFDSEGYYAHMEPYVKKAQLKVDHTINTTLAEKLRDKNKGLDHYDEYNLYLAKRHTIDEAADNQEKKAHEDINDIDTKLEVLKAEESPIKKPPTIDEINAMAEEAEKASGVKETVNPTQTDMNGVYDAQAVATEAGARTAEETREVLNKAEEVSKEDLLKNIQNNIC